ncbi:MAG TPA: WHG domain-containing protein [Aggregatilineales bacterium]|nr:WHG domain-containing protein [Aggregatilineales bacterium]
MPYPTHVTLDSILNQARTMIEMEGVEALSLNVLAEALGVKTPSLYRYVDGRAGLLRALNLQTVQQLVAATQAAHDSTSDPLDRFIGMMRQYRTYALANPMGYTLAFASAAPDSRPDPALLEALAIPLQQEMARISGIDESLMALRGAWALVHGYVLLEIHGQFQRGGDLEATFEGVVRGYLQGWQPAT